MNRICQLCLLKKRQYIYQKFIYFSIAHHHNVWLISVQTGRFPVGGQMPPTTFGVLVMSLFYVLYGESCVYHYLL